MTHPQDADELTSHHSPRVAMLLARDAYDQAIDAVIKVRARVSKSRGEIRARSTFLADCDEHIKTLRTKATAEQAYFEARRVLLGVSSEEMSG